MPAQPRLWSADQADQAAERLLQRRFTARELPLLRVQVEECAAWAGLAETRRGDFVLAVDAVATNAVEHAGGAGALLLRRVGDELECRISDSGPGFSEDVIPRILPGLDGATSGRGLWLTRLVTDRLAVSAGAVGTVVTLAMRLR
ncbi:MULTISPECIES: ATP-binding protein [unclassified Streptomyces]|uniref:ATP-binding protein n=1 Tax=unclassified Streptomyces TaxID=2593676 RepID=UPI00336A971C